MTSFFNKRMIKLSAVLFIVASFFVTQNLAISATTGVVYPSLGTTASETPWSDNNWTTPTNIYTDNGVTANVTSNQYDNGDQTRVLKATGFNFSSIPDGSTINGVTARINSFYRSGQGSGSMDLCQLLSTTRTKVGTNQCSTPVALTTTTSTIITKGGSTDTWGNSLTTTWIKDPDFGIAIGVLATANNAEVDVDYITLEITYTPPITSFAITATAGANGATTPSGITNVTQGGSQTYTITPDIGYDVETLVIDGGPVATSTSYTFTNVQATHTIYATFALLPTPPDTHTITSSAGSNGTINPLGATIITDGTSQIFNIIPDSGFNIETLVVDSVSIATSTSYTFSSVTSDHTISATFSIIPPPPGSFTIIAYAGLHGTVLPLGSTVVPEGGSQTYTITPDFGYDIENLIIDSFPIATSTSHTFSNVQADHTIEATFTALTGEVAVVATTRRLASITFSGKAFPGGKISIVQKVLETENIASQEYFTNVDGYFSIRFIDLPEGAHSFGLLIKDIDGRISQTKFFLVDVSRGDEIFKDIVTPPTIDVLYGQVSRGTNAKIFGYASPGHTIRVYLNDILNKEVLAGRGGVYSFELPTGALNFGQYTVRTKQINLDGGKESDFSTSRTFIVSNLAVVKADLSGDGKVDIKDWSIFLARWGTKDSIGRIALDISGDGKVDIADFSIFIKTIRKK